MFNRFNFSQFPKVLINLIDWLIIVLSALLCLLLSPTRMPGMVLLGISPNWLLIWLVTWSVKRSIFQATIAGITLGLIQDGISSFNPTHVVSLVVVGVISSRIQKHRYLQEDFISIAIIVFFMVMISETITAFQYIIQGFRPIESIWDDFQRISLTSAILSSLWAPVIYYPLNLWWENLKN